MSDRRLWAYINETGDRGMGPKSSPIFGMAALLADVDGARNVRSAVDQLRSDFKVPHGRVMSWKQDAKNHDRRRHAARTLAQLKHVKVCYVYAQKDALNAASYVSDAERFYNYVAGKTYTSDYVKWIWPRDDGLTWPRFWRVVVGALRRVIVDGGDPRGLSGAGVCRGRRPSCAACWFRRCGRTARTAGLRGSGRRC